MNNDLLAETFCGNFCVLPPSLPTTTLLFANEYTFVCSDGKLMPENFPAGKFLRKANNCFGVYNLYS
jgi:hypothetical protein